MTQGQYWTCPYCGANLDPGEACDFQTEAAKRAAAYERVVKYEPRTGQMALLLEGVLASST